MPPKARYYPLIAALSAMAAFFPSAAGASEGRACLSFVDNVGMAGLAGVANTCSEWRTAAIQGCGRRAMSIKVPPLAVLPVRGSASCRMRIAGDRPSRETQAQASANYPQKQSRRAKAEHISPATGSVKGAPARLIEPLSTPKPSTNGHEEEDPRDALSSNTGITLAFMEPAATESPLASPATQKTMRTNAPALIDSATLRAVFQEGSDADWKALLCSRSGQILITETGALLNRRATLKTILETYNAGSIAGKTAERIDSEHEMQAIDRELSKFRDRAGIVLKSWGRN